MHLPIKTGSRASSLALIQVEEVLNLLQAQGISASFENKKYLTAGDKDKLTSLTSNPGDNFFSDALDEALLKGEIDIAIHSAKDLPQNLPNGLSILALTKGMDDRDAWVGKLHFNELPPKAQVGTSSQLRQSQVLLMRPDIEIVDIRGTIAERIELIKQGKVDGIIVAACALKRLGLEAEIKDYFPWEGMALQGQLAIVGRADDLALSQLFKKIDVRLSYGKVVLVGAGPGDPELITVKGIKALERADCVFYDYLADKQLLSYAPQAEHIYVGKRKGEHSMPQEQLSRLLKEKALSGKRVVRLKGGDPLVFGRGADEISFLRSFHIQVDIIPGVSSATGIPSLLGLPLTARGISSSVAFLSGHDEHDGKGQPQPLHIPKADTLVFFMGLTKLTVIMTSLKKEGWPLDTPVMVISNGTRPDEKIVQGSIANIEIKIAEEIIKPPAMIIVGRTIDLYKPQHHLTFLHCGTHPDLYRHYGKIIHHPLIEIKPSVFEGVAQELLWHEFKAADVILCTSRYGVQCFINEMLKMKKDINWQEKTFAAIGKHTQKTLEAFGIFPKIVAKDETAQGLFKALTQNMKIDGKQILFPRSSIPNPFLKDALTKEGARVVEITVYENNKTLKCDLPKTHIDGVIFTAPSTLRNFLEDYGKIPPSWKIIAKGPVTAQELSKNGYKDFLTEH